MNDDQKWLQAAAGIEQDIHYLQAAISAGKWNSALDQEIHSLNMVLAVYRRNASAGVAWPHPDDLYCINHLPYGTHQPSIAMRRDFKTAV